MGKTKWSKVRLLGHTVENRKALLRNSRSGKLKNDDAGLNAGESCAVEVND